MTAVTAVTQDTGHTDRPGDEPEKDENVVHARVHDAEAEPAEHPQNDGSPPRVRADDDDRDSNGGAESNGGGESSDDDAGADDSVGDSRAPEEQPDPGRDGVVAAVPAVPAAPAESPRTAPAAPGAPSGDLPRADRPDGRTGGPDGRTDRAV
ncbi:hypothetical protein OK074_4644, partial [Actinobacteria bacterium OK074]